MRTVVLGFIAPIVCSAAIGCAGNVGEPAEAGSPIQLADSAADPGDLYLREFSASPRWRARVTQTASAAAPVVPHVMALRSAAAVVPGPYPHLVNTGVEFSGFRAINNLGEGVGLIQADNWGTKVATSSFYWKAGPNGSDLVIIDILPTRAIPHAMNDTGVVVGSTTDQDAFAYRPLSNAFRWTAAEGLALLGSLSSGGSSGAHAINAAGTAAGWSSGPCIDLPLAGAGCTVGVLFNGGLVNQGGLAADAPPTCSDASSYKNAAQLNAINSSGRAVGLSSKLTVAGNSCSLAGHAWSPGTDLHPTGASYSEAFGINDNGVVVGMADQQSVEPIIWESGVPRRLPDLGRGGVAVRINNNGYIIGFVYATNTWGGPTTNGAVWKPDGTLVNLGENSLPYDLNSQNRVAGTLAGTYGGWQPAIWDFGPMITVTATLTPNHVAPVEAHCFDAESQIAYRCFTSEVLPDSRTDVAQLQVAVVYNNGEPVRGAAVESTATVETGSGGHQHGDDQTRPVGTFYSTAENPNTATGSRRTIAGITAADGTAAFQYKSSGLSGFENLKVKVTLPNGVSAEAVARLSIEVPGLIELPRSATDYVVAGVTDKHPQNNFGTQDISDAAAACFSDYKSVMDIKNLPYFEGPARTKFVITEVGLPSGGMLDTQADWTAPHQTHRFGRQLDLRTLDPATQTLLFDAARRKQLKRSCLASGFASLDPEGNHYHLSLGAP